MTTRCHFASAEVRGSEFQALVERRRQLQRLIVARGTRPTLCT